MGDGRNDKERARKYDTRKSKSAYAVSKETGVAENFNSRHNWKFSHHKKIQAVKQLELDVNIFIIFNGKCIEF